MVEWPQVVLLHRNGSVCVTGCGGCNGSTELEVIPAAVGGHLAEAIREIAQWPNPVGIDDPVNSIGRLTENTSPPGDLYGPRITTARNILRDALARYEREVGK